jgi:predicted dehydrogenase
MTTRFPRREFLKTSAVSAGLLAAGYTATAKGFAANETLQVGCIGTGGRCRRLMQELANITGVKITAVCDVWDQHLAEGRKLADPKAAATKDYRELLEREDVDAVLIGTPDHLHVPITVAACQAGKDVYVEKPLTHELAEGQAVIDAQNKHKRIVQVGTQQRSMPHFQKGAEIVRSGRLGKIHKVHLTWNRNTPRAKQNKLGVDPKTVDWKRFLGPAKEQPFDEYRFRNWRWFWDFGGGIFTDLMVHYIDVAHWFLDLDHPQVAASIGDHYMAKDLWETPDTVQTLLRYPTLTRSASEAARARSASEGVQVYFEGTFINARNAAMLEFMGTDATLYLDRGRYEIHPERNRRIQPSEYILGKGPRGADFYDQPNGELLHLANWVECVRSRQKPNCPAEAGVSAASAAHLANLSLRRGEIARWTG